MKNRIKEKKIGLTTKIFIALFLGAITGVILYYVPSCYIRDTVLVEGIFYVVGQGFLRLMQMLVVPLVFCSLICGSSAMGDTKTMGKVGMKTLIFYLCTTAIAVSVAISIGLIFKPGLGLDTAAIQSEEVTVAESTSFTDTLLNIIPKNPIQGLSEGNMLQIILFALIIGIILTKLGERAEIVSNFFAQFNEIMMEMTNMVMSLAPIGVYCLISRTFAGIGFDGFKPMAKYMLCVLFALLIHCFVVYSGMFLAFTRLNPYKFIRKYLPVMSFAFSTATSNATIPMAIETLEEKMGVSKKISSFTIPLGATINMDGTAIMQGVAVCFAAQAFGIPLTITDYVTVIATATLASIGTAGVPSVGLITLSMVFNSVGLPVEGIALIMGIDRILDMARTAVNITGDAMCTTIVAFQDGSLDKEVFNSK
jgi:Na+/H+-dicarboxylate symporter